MPLKSEGKTADDIIMDGIGIPTYDNLRKYLDAMNSAGIFEGGTISDSGSGEIDIASAKGVIRTTDSDIGELVAFDIAAITNVSLTDNSMNYIYVDYNAGTPILAVTTSYDTINHKTQIVIGRVFRIGTSLYISNIGAKIANATLRDMYRVRSLRKFERSSGGVLSNPSGLYLATTAMVGFSNYDKITIDSIDTSGAGRFTSWYRSATPGVWTRVTSQQSVDNVNYDDGDGTLAAVSVGNFGVFWVYMTTDGTLHLQYGQGNYATLNAARAALLPASQPPLITEMGELIARIIVGRNASTINEVASAYDTVFTTSTAAIHNELASLQGGTAGQYYHLTSAQSSALTPITGLSSTTPTADSSTGGVGTETTVARADHYHPLSSSYALSSHAHGNITSAGAIGSTATLPIITTTSGVLTTGTFGTIAGTFCQGNDSRLSDSRTPLSHTHGNITNAGAIGSTSGATVVTTTSGVLTTGTCGIGYGGTGLTSIPTNGQLLIGNGSRYTLATLTQGTGITITNASGSITIAASSSGATIGQVAAWAMAGGC